MAEGEWRENQGFGPGLISILDSAAAAGWNLRPTNNGVELLPQGSKAGANGFIVNGKWWCHDLGPAGQRQKAFRVTHTTLKKLLGLPYDHTSEVLSGKNPC